MENAKIIIPRPAYIAGSFEWNMNDLKKEHAKDVDKQSLCQSALDDVKNGSIKISPIEKLVDGGLVFIDSIGKVKPKENEVYIQNPYNKEEYISSSCFLEKIQKQRYSLYRLLLQKLGAKHVYKKSSSSRTKEESQDINFTAGKTIDKQSCNPKNERGIKNEKSLSVDIKKELNELFEEDYWEEYNYKGKCEIDFTKEYWDRAKDFVVANNLQNDDDFNSLLEQRNPDNPMLLDSFETHYNSKKDCTSVLDLNFEIDIAKTAFGFNPATKIMNRFLKLSFDIDFELKRKIHSIMEQSIELKVEF